MNRSNMQPLPPHLLDVLGEYGHARTDFAVGSPSHIEAWQKTIVAIKEYALELVLNEREACMRACTDDVVEPPYHGYECPNTFQDGVTACVRAIRARTT